MEPQNGGPRGVPVGLSATRKLARNGLLGDVEASQLDVGGVGSGHISPKPTSRQLHVSLAENHRCDPVVRLRINFRFARHPANGGSVGPDRAEHEAVSSTSVIDRKSTRLNSSHLGISYAVFCLKKDK